MLDVAPPALRRRGAAAARAGELAAMDGAPGRAPPSCAAGGWSARADLAAMGVPAAGTRRRRRLARRPGALGAAAANGSPTEVAAARRRRPARAGRAGGGACGTARPARPRAGRRAGRAAADASAGGPRASAGTPGYPAGARRRRWTRALADLAGRPFPAPEAYRLAELGLGTRQLGGGGPRRALLRLADGVVLRAGAAERAVAVLRRLPQPFTVSEARQALDTSRRVAVPLLELLDRRGVTRRLPDDRRTVMQPS